MAIIELGGPVKLGKGCVMRFKVDDSKSTTDTLHQWCETTYDGKEGSWCPMVPPHWHMEHDEYITVLEGSVNFSLDGNNVTLSAGDAELHVPRLHVHGFNFTQGVKTVLKEYTDPVGDYKEAFFRDMLQNATDNGPSLLMALRAFKEGDAYVALPGGFKVLDRAVTSILGFVASFFVPRKAPLVRANRAVE